MTSNRTRKPAVTALLLAAVAAGLGACSDGLELNGKLFDALGVSTAAQNAKSVEPKLASRPGLIIPPDASRLPQPGSGGADEGAAALAALSDPDKKRAADAAERERLHAAYCSGQMNWKERVKDPNAPATSPYGPCGMLSDFGKQ